MSQPEYEGQRRARSGVWVRVWVRAWRVWRVCVRLGAFKLYSGVIYRLVAENVLKRKFCTKICKCQKKVVPLQKN